jgi:hypothetical protein
VDSLRRSLENPSDLQLKIKCIQVYVLQWVANISLGDDDTFYYDVDFTPGFGDRKESRILEWQLSENVKQYITTLSATPAPGAPHLLCLIIIWFSKFYFLQPVH